MQYIRAFGALWMFSVGGFACQESNPGFDDRPSAVGGMTEGLDVRAGDTQQSPQQTETSADGGAVAVGGFASASAGRAAVTMSAMGGMATRAGMSAVSGVPADAGMPGDGGATTAGMAIVGGGSAVAGTPVLGGGDTAGTSALGGGDEAGMSDIGGMPSMGGLPLIAGMPRPGGAAVAGRPPWLVRSVLVVCQPPGACLTWAGQRPPGCPQWLVRMARVVCRQNSVGWPKPVCPQWVGWPKPVCRSGRCARGGRCVGVSRYGRLWRGIRRGRASRCRRKYGQPICRSVQRRISFG